MGKMSRPTLVKKGAEAYLYVAEWQDRKVVIKRRFPKKYRHAKLDRRIRTYRTIHEPKLLCEAKKAGVPTPLVYLVDTRNAIIVMEFVEGKQLKTLLNDMPEKAREKMCFSIGTSIGRLHERGMIHGDLTTSNMILSNDARIFFVDFGLSEKTEEIESKAVDLHLMKRALQSTHFHFAQKCFMQVMEGYSTVVGSKVANDVLNKIRGVETRGRYVTERRV